MNVLLISPLPPPAGGMASWTQKFLMCEQTERIHVVHINTALTGKRAREIKKRYYFHELKRMHAIQANIRNVLKQNSIDVVHLNCAVGKFGSIIKDYLFARTVKKYKSRLITHFHCDLSYMVDSATDRFFFQQLVNLSDAVLTLNDVSKKYTYDTCGRISIDMPNFIPDDYFDSVPVEKETAETIQSALFVGSVKEAKGCDVIFKTAERFPDIQFNLIGHISEPFKRMTKPFNIRLFGEVPNEIVKKEMLRADVFLFPTHTEGFPYVILEAMACGLPIISTPVGAIPDMLEGGSGGILVPVSDVDAVIEAMTVLQNKEAREKMACWNHHKASESYSTSSVMNRLFEIYHRVTVC